MKLFGTSGIRRVVGKDLMRLAHKIGLAVGNSYGSVVVGCDTRTSSCALKHAVISGLLAGGAGCQDAGVLPTPTLAFAAREFKAGVMITASHNPPQYNGFKMLNPDGSAFDARQRGQIEKILSDDSVNVVQWTEFKDSGALDDVIERHVQRILRGFHEPLNIKVVLDCGCGAASVITPSLLERLGCEVISLNCHPSGLFPRDVEPVEANLGELMDAVKVHSAALGIAHDGDADRMMAVDDMGRFIPGDKLLALFARQVGAKRVVTTIDASMVIDEMGFDVDRTEVGDPYVSEQLKKGGDFGGEPSGSWVFPAISLCPDGIYAAAQIAAVASRQRLSQMVDDMPSYPLIRGNVNSGREVNAGVLEERLRVLEPLSVSNIDGIKLNFADGWLLARASGTEPKIRLAAEAKSEARARQLFDSGAGIVEDCTEGKQGGGN